MHRVWATMLLLCAWSYCGTVKLEQFRSQYPNGKPKEVCTYYVNPQRDTVWHGKYESWYPNGRQHEQGWYRDGMKDSLWTQWPQTDGKQTRVTWRCGAIRVSAQGDTLRPGASVWRRPEGRADEQGRYRGGKRDSLWVCQGCETSWRLGVMDGLYVVREVEGLPLARGVFVNGTMEGEWVLRYPLVGEAYYGLGRFRGGLKEGRWVEYWWIGAEDRRACVTGNYVHGRREGTWQFLTSCRHVDPERCWLLRYAAGKRVEQRQCPPSPPDTCGCGAFFAARGQ